MLGQRESNAGRGRGGTAAAEDPNAHIGQGAGNCHIGEDAHDQNNDKGTYIPTAKSGQCAIATISRKGHTVAEGEAARYAGPWVPSCGEIDRIGQIDPAKRLGGETGRNRHANGNAPHAHALNTAAIKKIFQSAEGAKPANAGSEPKNHPTSQADPCDNYRF